MLDELCLQHKRILSMYDVKDNSKSVFIVKEVTLK